MNFKIAITILSFLSLLAYPFHSVAQQDSGISLIVLGNVQDGGSPHIGCKKECCAGLFEHPDPNRMVVSLGVIDHTSKKTYIFEATPDFTRQTRMLSDKSGFKTTDNPDGIFLTHAHIGHYTGLMYLGKEATNAHNVPVYCMPRMQEFLENNGPWSQLVSLENIDIQEIRNLNPVELSPQLTVIPFLVPHRDEYSETVGFKIIGPGKSAIFIPDIDKWERWDSSIVEVIKSVDYAFLDATFYDAAEINNRDISLIPHPFVIESMKLFEGLPENEKKKIYFIHFNHTNPLLKNESEAQNIVIKNGFKMAVIYQIFRL